MGRCDAKPGGALTAIEGPHGAVPADVMAVRGRGPPSPETLPNSKLLTKARYELSSVRSSSTYPQVSRIAKSEKVGPTAQSGLAVCRASVRALRNVGGMSAHVRDFDGIALIARETDRAGHAPLFPEANSNRFEQWPPSMLDTSARHQVVR